MEKKKRIKNTQPKEEEKRGWGKRGI